MNDAQVTPSVVYPPKTGSERRSHGLVSRFPSNGRPVGRFRRRSRGLPSLGRYAHGVELAMGYAGALPGLRPPDGDPGFGFVDSREAASDALSPGDAPDLAPLAMALRGFDESERMTGAVSPGLLTRPVARREYEGGDFATAAKREPGTGRPWRNDRTSSAMCRPSREPLGTVWALADRVRCRARTVRTVYHRGVVSTTRPMEGAH